MLLMNRSDPLTDGLFSARSVAVVGARPGIDKPGGRCLAFLTRFGFTGSVFPVNPKYEEIDGLRCYPDLTQLPSPVDLVMLIVPAAAVIEHLKKASGAGAKAAIVFSSGFAETGEAGKALQDELAATARDLGIAVLGPNCLGLIDLHAGLVASFSTGLSTAVDLRSGPAAFVSQSGAMGMAVFTLAQRDGVRFGKFLSTGNEAVLGLTDFVEHLSGDESTSLVLGYVEGLRDGRRFVDVARRARRAGKAVGVLKVGRSKAGEMAARSHTGALSGSAQAYDAAFRRAGVLCADSVQDLVDLAVVSPGDRRAANRNVGIVSMSGGAGVMMSDACSEVGLDVAPLNDATLATLSGLLPSYAGFTNPVDVGPIYDDLDAVFACIESVAKDPGLAQVLVFFGMSPLLVGRSRSDSHNCNATWANR
jgi:acyl-CoA synthetase (NDP forming)